MIRTVFTCLLVLLSARAVAVEPDARWPDFGVVAADGAQKSGDSLYFQGFESPCFGPPYNPAPDADWIRFFSEVQRVPSGSGGIASRSGFAHAELRPPLPGAPGSGSGAFTRLGGYSSQFAGGFVVEVEVHLDLADPRVVSGINADYGFDVAAAVNTQAGGHRRDFIFHVASNSAGQLLVGSSNTSNFAVRADLANGPHHLVTATGWYTFRWVFRDAGDGTLAVDTQLLDGGGLLWTRALNNPADVIATQIGGNRYLWFLFLQTERLAIDNSRINSGIREAELDSSPLPGATLNAGSATPGSHAPGTSLQVGSVGSLGLELCSCSISGPSAGDFSVSGCPAVVASGANLTLGIGCTPAAAGTRTATLTLVTNDSVNGSTYTYPLVCSGVVPPAPINIPSTGSGALVALAVLGLLLGLGALARRP